MDFTEIDLNKNVEDMNEEEAKETLSDFMEVHRENEEAYDAKTEEVEAVEAEYEDKIEDLEEKVSEFKQKRAEEAAEYTNVPADIMAERFDFSELDKIIEEGEEADFSEEEDEADETEESFLSFSEKEEKGRTNGGTSKYRKSAKSRLNKQWGKEA